MCGIVGFVDNKTKKENKTNKINTKLVIINWLFSSPKLKYSDIMIKKTMIIVLNKEE